MSAGTAAATVIGRATPAVPNASSCIRIVRPMPQRPVTSAPAPLPVLSNEVVDVTLAERRTFQNDVRQKFTDIFEVGARCSKFAVDLDQYDDSVNVLGRLQLPSSLSFFEEIGASDFVIKSLREGHYPKLKEPVPDFEYRNNASFFKHKDFAEQSVKDLIAKGRVRVLQSKPKCVNPISVAVQRLKSRFILDCSHLNKYIEIPHIKYEGHETALNYFKKGGYMYNFDLRDGYHHLMIHPDFQTYLGFCICLDGVPTYCCYVVGCFGLADLPFLFSKVYRPLVRHWRSLSIPGIMFLDDGGFFEADYDSAVVHSEHVKKDIVRSGSIFSIKKSNFTPSQKMTWLGFDWDTKGGTFSAASHRVEKIKNTCDYLLILDNCPVRKLSSFVGQIISLSPVVGNCAKVTTKVSQHFIAKADSWDDNLVLSSDIKREILFWKDQIDLLNCRSLCEEKPPQVLNLIEGDASGTGCGSWLNKDKLTARIFSAYERETHSTFRELANVHFSLMSFLPEIKNTSVKFLVDSQSAVHIIKNGSMKPELQYFATEVFHLCFQNNVKLYVQWIPREQNKMGDLASREADIADVEDWGITRSFFIILNNLYGPFTLDAFANFYNMKVPRFYSLYHCPGTCGVDAFLQDWEKENVLMVPPVSAVGRALSHLRLCKSKGVLIVPKWPSSHFWPLLMDEFYCHISDIKVFKGKHVLCHGLNTNSLLGAPYFNGDILAVVLDCS